MPEQATAVVPNLIGLTVSIARKVGHDAGLVVTSTDLDGPALGAVTWPGTWVVTAQDPTAGHRLRRGAVVKIEFEKFRE
jgi:beta-lactam-binding protein with PASTA domain